MSLGFKWSVNVSVCEVGRREVGERLRGGDDDVDAARADGVTAMQARRGGMKGRDGRG